MKRGDDVFLFTLVDFLLQVFFFGLLVYVVAQATSPAPADPKEQAAKDVLLKGVGVSSITELTDLLTKLAPLDHLRGTSEYIARQGGLQSVIDGARAADEAGGPPKVRQLRGEVDALRKQLAKLEGWGKVSCIPNVIVNGQVKPKSIARASVFDDHIELTDPTPEMTALLASHGLKFETVRSMKLAAFRAAFAPVVEKQPECRYFLDVVTRTEYLQPMRAVWSVFRTQ